jgi:glycosyltransferase involved in cell wall biosynthesis
MKILILIQCTNLGGMEQCMLLLIDEFKKMNIESEVVSIVPVGELEKLLNDRGVSVTGGSYQGPGGFLSFLEMRRILKSKAADGLLMIGHNLMAETALGTLYRDRSALALHYHHQGVKSPLVWRLIYRLAARSFNKMLFVSEYIMKEAFEVAPFIREKSEMIGTLIKEQPILSGAEKAAAKQHLGIDPNAFVIGNAGWLIQRKRWDVFLEVAARVNARVPEARFVIAGDGPERRSLEQEAKMLGILGTIDWIGWQKNLDLFYRSIDALLFNSDWDAQPRTPLEAMSHGVPVVASILHGGTSEIIRNEGEGILLKDHDFEKMAEMLILLAKDKGYREKLGESGRRRILECASPKRNAEATLRAMKLV